MKSEFTIRLADLDLPIPKGEPRSGATFRKKVVEALERTYQGFGRVGKLEISVAEESVSVALTTDDGVNPVALALADLKAGRVDDGVSLLEFLHASAPEDPEVLFLLGSCLSDSGDLARAEAYLRRAVELRPTSADWLVNFGVVLTRTNKPVEAEEVLSKAVELAPGNPYAHRNLGACVARAGQNLAKAQKHLEQAVALAPRDPQSWFGLARLYQTQGKTDAARGACQRVLAIEPGGPLASHAQALLKQL
jgi:Flp pilus assembly protein TadD